ncbi:unnamed protein product [Knipowitschia caucasica]|uniref:EGF-like domain-containing protein n=1 Tax=Knipowitschia caucasica TaxID=637954 RepID=A0AAV2IX33_KNICA
MLLSLGPNLRLLRLLLCITIVLNVQITNGKKNLKSACSTCRQITDNFNKGFDKTSNQNFGGGNTAWEERTLSKYETSEIRLMEIIEGLCDSSSFDCNQMLEEHEDHLETWWFKRKLKNPDLHKWFCIETISVCCPNGTFGPDCNACVGGSDKPCHGNGQCDGDGTRGGNGKCSCDSGYEGEFCLDCVDGYFNQEKNETFSLCMECHSSCKTCNGPSHQDCDECKDGWEEDDNEACVDVNECTKEASPCKEDEHCLNTEGSFSCKGCDKVCVGCTGPGPGNCKTCASGYQLIDGNCTDVDECSQQEPVCTKEHQDCVNTKGSFVCICAYGFEEEGGECVQKPQPEEKSVDGTTEPTETSQHTEL